MGNILRKFAQIAVEFHAAGHVTHLMSDQLLKRNLCALRRLLESFVLVHVHATTLPILPDGSCLEVTFAQRDAVEHVPCEWPRLLPDVDRPNSKNGAEVDPFALFSGIAANLQHLHEVGDLRT